MGGQGRAALAQLGVPADLSGNGLTALNRILDGLDRMQDGLKKTELEEQIFGARG